MHWAGSQVAEIDRPDIVVESEAEGPEEEGYEEKSQVSGESLE